MIQLCLIVLSVIAMILFARSRWFESDVDKFGTITYKLDGQLHREDGPALEYANGDKFWYKHGKLHREAGHAVEWADGTKFWYINGKCHKEDGPAIEHINGDKCWCINGEELTEEEFNKRPIKTVDKFGTITYKLDGQLHREDGPAIEYANGIKHWFINGKLMWGPT